jgi:hypothetical protein
VENKEEEKLRAKEAKEERVVTGMGHVVKDGKGYFEICNFYQEHGKCYQRTLLNTVK